MFDRDSIATKPSHKTIQNQLNAGTHPLEFKTTYLQDLSQGVSTRKQVLLQRMKELILKECKQLNLGAAL